VGERLVVAESSSALTTLIVVSASGIDCEP
jgi:hypothetical protein